MIIAHQLSPAKQAQREAEDKLWAAYVADRSSANRNAIMLFHHNMAWSESMRYARSQFNRRKISVDEVASEAAVMLLRCVELFDTTLGFRFTTYFTRSFRMTINDLIRGRSKRKRAEVLLGERDLHVRDIPRPSLSPFEDEIGCEWVQAIADLPLRSQVILKERFFGGMTYEVIAKRHAVSRERVRQIIVNSIMAIRKDLEIDTPNWKLPK